MKLSTLKSVIQEELRNLLTSKPKISKHLQYHMENHSTLVEGVFRYGSDSYLNLFEEARNLHAENKIKLSDIDKHLLKILTSENGVNIKKTRVPLDCPFQIHEAEYQGKDVELNKPKRGGDKEVLCVC